MMALAASFAPAIVYLRRTVSRSCLPETIVKYSKICYTHPTPTAAVNAQPKLDHDRPEQWLHAVLVQSLHKQNTRRLPWGQSTGPRPVMATPHIVATPRLSLSPCYVRIATQNKKPRLSAGARGCVQDGGVALESKILPRGPPTVKMRRAFSSHRQV